MSICPWPLDYTACGATPGDPDATPPIEPSTGCAELDAATPEQRALFEEMATDLLYEWTGRQFGACEVSIRPCRSDCDGARAWASTFWGRGPYPWQGIGASGWLPTLISGEWLGVSCSCAGACRCSITGPSSLALPGPILDVTEVRIDGVTLDPSAYRVMYDRVLVRTDGSAWPTCQNMLAPPTAVDTFEVTYRRGVEVPVGGRASVAMLACELAKAACGSGECQLPERIQTITRQGVTIGVADSFADLKDGKTGIWMIDAWMASVARGQTVARPTIASPDFRMRTNGQTTGGQWR